MIPSQVLTPNSVFRYINGNTWILESEFVYYSALIGTIRVPVGFATDFNSVPRVFWWIMPKSQYGLAGLIHDWLYFEGRCSRELADMVFREALEALGAPGWKLKPMYWAVRAGGWRAWDRYRAGRPASAHQAPVSPTS